MSIIRQREKRLDSVISLNNFWDNFQKIKKPTNKIVSIVSITGIPKETVRRKVNFLQNKEVIIRSGKSIFLNSKGLQIQKPMITIENMSGLLSKLSIYLSVIIV